MISNIAMKNSYIVVDLFNFKILLLYKYEISFTNRIRSLGWTVMLTFPYKVQDHDRLRGLSLAIHTLKQLTNNQNADIIDIASKYDHDENFIMSVKNLRI